MIDESNDEESSAQSPQYSLRTLFKITAYSAVLIYFVWSSWGNLGFSVAVLVLMSPFIFFAEIVDLLLGVKRR